MVAGWPEEDRIRLARTFKLRWNLALTTAKGCCGDLDGHEETAVDGLKAVVSVVACKLRSAPGKAAAMQSWTRGEACSQVSSGTRHSDV